MQCLGLESEPRGSSFSREELSIHEGTSIDVGAFLLMACSRRCHRGLLKESSSSPKSTLPNGFSSS